MRTSLLLAGLLSLSLPSVAWAEDASPAAAVPAPPPETAAFVQLGGDPVDLEQQVGPKEWRPICSTPCNATVFGQGTYRVSGDGIRASKPFVLARPEGRNALWVDGASSVARAGSLGLIGGGAAAVGVGVFLVFAGAFGGSKDLAIGGVATAGAGLVALVAGVVWLAVTGRTTVEQRDLAAVSF